MCTEAAIKVKISPVALDFFTLVSEDGSHFLNPDKTLCEEECSQVYKFTLCMKACHARELREYDKQAFEYYFHQVCNSHLENFATILYNLHVLTNLFAYSLYIHYVLGICTQDIA